MTTVKIDTGIPIPARGGYGKYPHTSMEVGQSFYVSERGTVQQAVSNYGRASGKKFTVRKEGAGYRCWRIL
jgi:hypothetical protein